MKINDDINRNRPLSDRSSIRREKHMKKYLALQNSTNNNTDIVNINNYTGQSNSIANNILHARDGNRKKIIPKLKEDVLLSKLQLFTPRSYFV